MTEPVDRELGIPEFRHISTSNIRATSSKAPESTAIIAEAYPEKPLREVIWKNVTIEAEQAGFIRHAQNWTMENVTIYTPDGEQTDMEFCSNVQCPTM